MLIVRMSPLGQDDVQVGTIVTTATNDHFHVTHECCNVNLMILNIYTEG